MEDFNLLYKIVPKCKQEKIKANNIVQLLEKENLKDKIIICVNYRLSYNVFRESKEYTPAWMEQPEQKIAGYDGTYREQKTYFLYNQFNSKQLIVIDKNKMGKLTQYFPVSDELSNEPLEGGIFFIGVDAFNERPDLLQQHINAKLPWLIEKGDEKAQKDYLYKHVWLRVLEKVDIVFPDGLIGTNYIIEE